MTSVRRKTARPTRPAAERGRPALPEGLKRDQRLVVKLRAAELEQLRAEAEAAGLPLGLYARLILTKRSVPDAK